MRTAARPAFFVLTAFLLFTAFYAQSYVAAQLHHEHDAHGHAGGCSVCHKIEVALLVLAGLGRVGAALALACAMQYARRGSRKRAPVFCRVPTLIALKVRLNP